MLVKIDALDLLSALRRLRERVADPLRAVQPELANAMRAAFAQSFATQGEGAWEPLNAETLARYQRTGFGDTLGEHSKQMWESLTTADAPGAFEELSSDGQQLTVGTTDPVAGIFDAGTRKQPARPFFADGVPDELAEQLAGIVERHLAEPFADLG